jgi:hypothetical protein
LYWMHRAEPTVCARERGHVAGVETVFGERGDEACAVGVRGREVVRGGVPVGAARVLAAELHVPCRAAEQ